MKLHVLTARVFGEGHYEPISARCAPCSGEQRVEIAVRLLNGMKVP